MKNYITINDLTTNEFKDLIKKAIKMKNENRFNNILNNKNLVMVFFNPSLRTRTSFQAAMTEMGGNSVRLDIGQGVWGMEWKDGVVMDGQAAEHLKEAVPVLSRYGQFLAVRSFPLMKSWDEDMQDNVMKAFAEYSEVPVINMESSLYHPCQGLADMMTVSEKIENPKGKKFVLSWANHPKPLPMAVPNSAVISATKIGMDVTIACPEGYELSKEIIDSCKENCKESGGNISVTNNLREGYDGAEVIYAKSWGSLKNYGKPEIEVEDRKDLKEWIVDEKNMSYTNDAYFMHCLPVRRNVVVSDSVIDSEKSIVVDQAENRLHAQKAILQTLLEDN